MSTLEKAIALAANLHQGQKRIKAEKGLPYIIHPLRVMLDTRFIKTDKERIVAVLHDVIEDTECTSVILYGLGFDEEIVEAVDSVTKREGESYDDFIDRAGKNEIGRRVKLADLHDNNRPPKEKYNKAIEKLMAL